MARFTEEAPPSRSIPTLMLPRLSPQYTARSKRQALPAGTLLNLRIRHRPFLHPLPHFVGGEVPSHRVAAPLPEAVHHERAARLPFLARHSDALRKRHAQRMVRDAKLQR